MENIERIVYNVEKTSCYTYFSIVGDFNPVKIGDLLGLDIESSHNIGDERKSGKGYYDFAACKLCSCLDYDVIVTNQMMKTITPLLPKVEILKQIKKDYKVDFTLVVVPYVRFDEPSPCLAPSKEVMQFCVETDTDIDIDLYVGCPDDYKGSIKLK